ncbi:MAG: FkbM family methyltransferase [Sphingobacteriales bacterium]|nr:FkbM family methyltransferase [Sphingobacteriales bacterium]
MFKSLKKLLIQIFFPHRRSSYSQSGEDIIIADLFSRLGISRPSYLDIGANEPMALNNTYRLYARGSKGVCIEPNPILYKKLRRKRKRDTCINAGIAFNEKKEADYYLFEKKAHGFSTFSKEDAEFWQYTGNEKVGKFKVEKILKTPLFNINEIIKNNFFSYPNLVSLDVEGLDLQILNTLDFSKYQPEVLCIETLVYQQNNLESKNNEIIKFLESKGYFIYADTYINSIFCRRDVYKNLPA